MTMVEQHSRWEFGTAPFRLVGLYSFPSTSLAEQNPTAYNAALRDRPSVEGYLGACAHCGTALVHNYIVRDAQGKRFAIGSKCVEHVGDSSLVSQVEHLEKLRKRDVRRAAAERRREAQQLAAAEKHQAELDAQRERNGGLTDAEVAHRLELKAESDRKASPEGQRLSMLASKLRDHKGGFRDSVAADLDRGEIPRGTGMRIMLDILAKQHGRRGSKAYASAYDEIEAEIEEMLK